MTEPEIIEIRDTEIDVQAIMAEIREKIAQQKGAGIFSPEVEKWLRLPLPGLPSTIAEEDVLTALSQKVRLDIDLPIRSHRRPPLGPMIVVGKKLLLRIFRWYFEQIALQVESFRRSVVDVLNKQRNSINNLVSELKRMDDLEKKLEEQERTTEAKLRWVKGMEDKIMTWAEREGLPIEDRTIDYLEFNRRFGGHDDVLRIYPRFLSFFKGSRDILDIGCGQGYFLELLRNEDISAWGIDVDEQMVRLCRERQLNAIQGEALSYLRCQKPNSLGGIFAAHLVEHLITSDLVAFVSYAHGVLRPGAPIVLISPNGRSTFVLTQGFYRDPTHVKPVHPETLAFLLESQGFHDLDIIYYEEVAPEVQFKKIAEEEGSPALQALNRHIGELNQFLFGFRDYAVVARK